MTAEKFHRQKERKGEVSPSRQLLKTQQRRDHEGIPDAGCVVVGEGEPGKRKGAW